MITHLVSVSDKHGTIEFANAPDALKALAFYLEDKTKGLDQIELSIKHKFAHGLYYREIFIPRGTVMSGRVHKFDDMNVIYFGDMEIISESGVRRVTGPASFTGRAGVKQWGHAMADTLWATIHATDLTDLAEIEKALFEDEEHRFDFVTGKEVQPCLPL